ncbi:MAG: M42 family peptidase [Oscillospiraceae bacterium]|nr:M42 family peptidase [Oscillospiraceae bacterium]
MLNTLQELCTLCGISGDEDAVRDYLIEQIAQCPDILECRTDRLGNLLVHKQGRERPAQRLMIGAHMDEVGLIVTGIEADGRLSTAPVGGIEPDVVLGRSVVLPGIGTGVAGSVPVHKLTGEQRDKKPKASDLLVDIGTGSREASEALVTPGQSVCYYGPWTPLGGGRVASKAIDDRFGCAVMLTLLREELPYDTWFCFFVQEEISLRGSRAAAFSVDPALCLILETTTAADLDGVEGADAVCRLGSGPVVSFMDRATIYDKALFRLAFETAAALHIPCQTKTRIAGGNDAGAVHITREGVRTLAVSLPCRYLHSPYTVADVQDMEHTLTLVRSLIKNVQTGERAHDEADHQGM